MFSKTVSVAAAMVAAAQAQDWGRYAAGPSFLYEPEQEKYEAPKESYGYNNYQGPAYGYGQKQSSQQSYGYPWGRRSFYRPRDVTIKTYEPVSDYWKTWEKPDEKINATCEFDFQGYSHSSGRVELSQEAGDLVTMIGEFENISPGLHGIKIHEFGDLEYGCESTGNVFNPFYSPQGDSHEDVTKRRVGDIEQVQARWDLGAEYKCRDGMLELSGPNSIIGRSMVLYERADDHDLTEHPEIQGREGRYRKGMGARIACCVIGLAKGETPIDYPKPKDQHIPFQPSFSHDGHRNFGW